MCTLGENDHSRPQQDETPVRKDNGLNHISSVPSITYTKHFEKPTLIDPITNKALDDIWRKYHKYKKPVGFEEKAWELTQELCQKIQDMISRLGRIDKEYTSAFTKKVDEDITRPCFLMSYYIGYEMASGHAANTDTYLMAVTKPIETFVLKLLTALLSHEAIDPEDGEKRVLEIYRLTGKVVSDMCLLGFEDYCIIERDLQLARKRVDEMFRKNH